MNSYCAVNAKIKAMYADCLKEKDYDNLIAMHDVGQVCSYLKSTPAYEDILKDLTESEMHRGTVEKILSHKLFTQYIRLYNFMDKAHRDILKFWFMRMEVEYLKHRIRYIFNNENGIYKETEDEGSTFFTGHTKINCKLAANSKTLSDFVESCIDTPYYKLLKTAETIKSDYFSIGMMLDRLYYTLLWKAKDKLPKSEKAAFEAYVGPICDMLNIMWIYRGKKYFDFDREVIYTYLIPVHYRLSEDSIKQMVSGEGAASVESVAANTRYKELFDGVGGEYFIEKNYSALEIKNSKRLFVNEPMSMAAIFAYFNLKEIEINKVTTIIEGVRYGSSPELLKEYIK